MKKQSDRQMGFAVVEVAIFIAVIVAVAGIGYWALNKSKAAPLASTATTDSTIISKMAADQDLSDNEVVSAVEVNSANAEVQASIQAEAKGSASFADRVISYANSQKKLPACEKGDNRGKEIKRYQEAMNASRCINQAWCASFVTYVYAKMGDKSLKECYVPWMVDKAQKQGRYKKISSSNQPKKGDIVVTNGEKHTAIFVKSYKKNGILYYTTIDGNSGSANTCVKNKYRKASSYEGFIKSTR